MKKIFVVEDDSNIRELICYALANNGYEAVGFQDAPSFYQALKDNLPVLCILDIMLEGDDGYSILNKIKESERSKDLPVIMLTAKSSEYDKVKGLDMGADDYITKPFGVMEFLSRVKAVLRRSGTGPEESIIKESDLIIDPQKRELKLCGEPVSLTYKEFELLYYLMSNPDIVLSRNRIMNVIWGYEYEGESRTVDVHIRSLRQKLGKEGDLIETVRNIGYKFRKQ